MWKGKRDTRLATHGEMRPERQAFARSGVVLIFTIVASACDPIVILVVLLTSGCFPYKYTVKPPVVGRVVDSGSGNPVQGAIVRFRESEQPVVVTDQDGSFALPAVKVWGLWILIPLSDAPATAHAVASADGYVPAETFVSSWGNVVRLNEPIRLERAR